MSTRPTPQEDDLFRAAAWVDKNELTVASIEKQAADLLVQMRYVAGAANDPKGLRVADLRRKRERLLELVGRLGEFPG
jgi:hypothetical protein